MAGQEAPRAAGRAGVLGGHERGVATNYPRVGREVCLNFDGRESSLTSHHENHAPTLPARRLIEGLLHTPYVINVDLTVEAIVAVTVASKLVACILCTMVYEVR